MKPTYITEMEVQEAEYYRLINDQITSINNIELWKSTKKIFQKKLSDKAWKTDRRFLEFEWIWKD